MRKPHADKSLRVVRHLALGAIACAVLAAPCAHADELLDLLGGGSSEGVIPMAGQPSRASVIRQVLAKAGGAPTAEQNIFIQFFDQGAFDKALYQWPSAFEGTAFAKSPSGRALNALVLFKNGIQVTGLEMLLSTDSPDQIAPELLKMWQDAAPGSHAVWGFVNTATWNPKWTETFGVATEIRVRGRQVYGADQTETIKELLKKAALDTRERAWLEWQLVLAMAQGPDSGIAAKALAHLMKVPNNPVSQDLMTMTAARLLYQNGFLDAAIKYYQKVPKSSDEWIDAQEEMAWAFIRKGEPQNAIALTKTLVNPVFAAQVGPEPIFLRALSLLKVCDYPGVVDTLKLFKERFRGRAKELMAIIDQANTPATQRLIAKMKQGSVKMTDLGADASVLPRFVTRDESLAQLVKTEKALEQEGKTAGDLYARSLTGGTGQVGFQARLDDFRQSVDARVQASRSATYARVKSLAEEELNEVSGILQKLHIVEAEVLQQLSLADRVISATSGKATKKPGTTGSQSRDRIWFPAENETWFDELANYRVDIQKGCESGSVKR